MIPGDVNVIKGFHVWEKTETTVSQREKELVGERQLIITKLKHECCMSWKPQSDHGWG